MHFFTSGKGATRANIFFWRATSKKRLRTTDLDDSMYNKLKQHFIRKHNPIPLPKAALN